jgi:hypothetical protein
MDKMLEFVNHEMVKDKIDVISQQVLGFKITNEGLQKSIEDAMVEMVGNLSDEMYKKSGQFDSQLAIAHLMDIVLVQLIVITLQNKYIEDKENG